MTSSRRVLWFIWVLLVFPVLWPTSAHAEARVVRVGVYDYHPLISEAPSERNESLFLSLLEHVASEERWSLQFIPGSYSELLLKLKAGELDLLPAAPFSKGGPDGYKFCRETVVSTWAQVYSHADTETRSMLDLDSKSVGYVSDDPYQEELKSIVRRLDIKCGFVEFKDTRQLVAALEKEWIDLGVMDRLNMLRLEDGYEVVRTPILFAPIELRFAAAAGEQSLLSVIDYHLENLKQDPNSLYYRSLRKAMGTVEERPIPLWLLWGAACAGGAALISAMISIMLRRTVRNKTSELSTKNAELENEVNMRSRAERELSLSEERYRTLVENTMDGYFVLEYPSGRGLFANQRLLELFGYTREEGLRIDLQDVIHPDDGEDGPESAYERLPVELRSPGRFTHTLKRKDGTTFRAEASTSLVTFKGKPVIQGVLRDVTEQERLEEQLQQARKMEAIGTLAGGTAHDFNNLLMGIQGNVSLILLDMQPTDPQFDRIMNIDNYVQKGSELTKQLLGFAKGGKYEVKPSDINHIIEESYAIFGRTHKEIQVRKELSEAVWTVELDRCRMEQVLLNLYLNSRQAMPEGGELVLTTRNEELEEERVRPFGVQAGKYVRVSVRDSGVGIPPEIQQRVFEPFFSTRGAGKGTGMGLASAYGIVKNHGGFITVESEKNKGATFHIFLPASDKPPSDERRMPEMLISGTEKVLLVDDEEMILDVGKEMLNRMGYDVVIASGGEEALSRYGSNGGFDLVILDMIMPGMNGGEVFDRLKAMDPSCRVLLSSGYSIEGQARAIMLRGCDGFIQKPFDLVQLSQRVREVLDPSRA
jgi:two-component system cell cycle sensor histidine kinase/response regulator CckA